LTLGSGGLGGPRYTQTIAGLAAAGAHHWETAEEHFHIAGRQADLFPDRLDQAEIRRFHAVMLSSCNFPGDLKKAQTLFSEPLENHAQIAMHYHIWMSHALLH
jgi:hypothetical protein